MDENKAPDVANLLAEMESLRLKVAEQEKLSGKYKVELDTFRNRSEKFERLYDETKEKLAPEQTAKERMAAVEQEMAKYKAERAALKQGTIRNALTSAVTSLGVGENASGHVVKLLMDQKYEVSDDFTSVSVNTGIEAIPVKQFVAGWLKSDAGEIFRPQVRAPKNHALGMFTTSRLTKEIDQYTPEEMIKLRQTDHDAYDELTTRQNEAMGFK